MVSKARLARLAGLARLSGTGHLVQISQTEGLLVSYAVKGMMSEMSVLVVQEALYAELEMCLWVVQEALHGEQEMCLWVIDCSSVLRGCSATYWLAASAHLALLELARWARRVMFVSGHVAIAVRLGDSLRTDVIELHGWETELLDSVIADGDRLVCIYRSARKSWRVRDARSEFACKRRFGCVVAHWC